MEIPRQVSVGLPGVVDLTDDWKTIFWIRTVRVSSLVRCPARRQYTHESGTPNLSRGSINSAVLFRTKSWHAISTALAWGLELPRDSAVLFRSRPWQTIFTVQLNLGLALGTAQTRDYDCTRTALCASSLRCREFYVSFFRSTVP